MGLAFAFLLLTFITCLLFIVGLKKPKLVCFWKDKENRTRKDVLMVYPLLSLLFLLAFLCYFSIGLAFLFLDIIIIILFVVGLIKPQITCFWKPKDRRTRKSVFIVYPFLVLAFLVVGIAFLPSPSSKVVESSSKVETSIKQNTSNDDKKNESKKNDNSFKQSDSKDKVISKKQSEVKKISDDENVINKTVAYVGNSKSRKFHYPTCNSARKIKNKVEFTSREDAINAGYTPCGKCHP